MAEFHTINIVGRKEELPVLALPSGVRIAFFNLHGNQDLTEYCGKKLAERIKEYAPDVEVLITAESKGLQLTQENLIRSSMRWREKRLNFICRTA